MRYVKCILLSMLFLFNPMAALAGDLDSPAAPTDAGSAMFTLEDIYNRLDTGEAGAKRSGAFVEPSSGPTTSTGHTLDEVMGLAPTVDDINGTVPAEVISGKIFWGLTIGNWGLKTGTMLNNGAVNYIPGTTNQTVAEGYHNGSGVVSGDLDLVTTNIRSSINIFGVDGDSNVVNTSSGDAGSGQILSGQKAWVDGSEVTGSLTCPPASTGDAVVGDVLSGKTFSNLGGTGLTGIMTNNGAMNYTHGTTNQTITEGYHNGSGHVAGDAALSAGNIKAGTEIFEVTGTFPSDGTAAPGDVKTGSTFYTNSATKHTGSGTRNISPANDMVSAGYYDATSLSAVELDLVEVNIKTGVNIFGKDGAFDGYSIVPKTGQTTSYATGDDGDLQKGAAWPNPRFSDNSDGTVTDNLTGLIWLQKANYNDTSGTTGTATWADALSFCNTLQSGQCGLTDGSSAGEWRLPNVKELFSLVDFAFAGPALPEGHPFSDVQGNYYWTSNTYVNTTASAWVIHMPKGIAEYQDKGNGYYVWPVRGGQ